MTAGDGLTYEFPMVSDPKVRVTSFHVQSRPGKSGRPLSISARTHPTLQTSIARVYSLNVSMTSGARYHLYNTVVKLQTENMERITNLVATYSVMKVLVSSASGWGRADRARPKSQI